MLRNVRKRKGKQETREKEDQGGERLQREGMGGTQNRKEENGR